MVVYHTKEYEFSFVLIVDKANTFFREAIHKISHIMMDAIGELKVNSTFSEKQITLADKIVEEYFGFNSF